MEKRQSLNEICEDKSVVGINKLRENTIYYIHNCLNPNQKWKRNYPARKRIDFVRCADVNWTAISDHIRGMDYQDFLATPYWKAIAAHTKYKAGYRCQVCNSGAYLTAHHRNYGIHGREHAHLSELTALCNRCHQKFHGNEKKSTAQDQIPPDKPLIMIVGVMMLLIMCFIWGQSMTWETFEKRIWKTIKPSVLHSHR